MNFDKMSTYEIKLKFELQNEDILTGCTVVSS